MERLNPAEFFEPLNEYATSMKEQMGASSSAIVVIKDDQIVFENYFGSHHFESGARRVDVHSRFNVYSVRVTYIGLAVAIAMNEGYINLDDPINYYLTELDKAVVGETSIRHLLTRCTGLKVEGEKTERIFELGTGIEGKRPDLLVKILQKATGKTVSSILNEKVFKPMELKQTGWLSEGDRSLVCDIQPDFSYPSLRLGSNKGDDRNLYVNARELAVWGTLHLKKGFVKGKQILPEEVFNLATTVQSPNTLPDHFPKFGFFWWIKKGETTYKSDELSASLPEGSYQILGASGCSCTVIPQLNAVIVRMNNSLKDYDYLEDIRKFNDLAVSCLRKSADH